MEKYNLTKIKVIKVEVKENSPLKFLSTFQRLIISNGNINKKYVIIKRTIIKKIDDNNFFINF